LALQLATSTAPIGLAMAVAAFLGAHTARAVEREHQVGIGAQFVSLKVANTASSNVGGGLGAHYSYGLTDQFNLMAEGGLALHVVEPEVEKGKGAAPQQPRTIGHVGVGVGYVFDVVSWVPYVGALATGYWLGGGTRAEAGPAGGLAAALGIDYRASRKLAVGLAARQHFVLSDFGTYPSWTSVGLRLSYTWGW
jgi:hypothetical protein